MLTATFSFLFRLRTFIPRFESFMVTRLVVPAGIVNEARAIR